MSKGVIQGNVCIHMQDYKSLHVAVMICTVLVNTHTHTNRGSFWPAILLAQPAELKRRYITLVLGTFCSVIGQWVWDALMVPNNAAWQGSDRSEIHVRIISKSKSRNWMCSSRSWPRVPPTETLGVSAQWTAIWHTVHLWLPSHPTAPAVQQQL